MNSIQDPSKKTSINSLLNPEASSSAAFPDQIHNHHLSASLSASSPSSASSPVAHVHQPHAAHQPVYGPPAVQQQHHQQQHHPHHAAHHHAVPAPATTAFVNASSFHLRAADWTMPADDGVNGHPGADHHQHHLHAHPHQHVHAHHHNGTATSGGGGAGPHAHKNKDDNGGVSPSMHHHHQQQAQHHRHQPPQQQQPPFQQRHFHAQSHGMPEQQTEASQQQYAPAHQQHQHQQQHARLTRSRGDQEQGDYHMDDQVWRPSQQDISTMPYGASAIAPVYSDERTAVSGDYQTHLHNNFSQSYQIQHAASPVAHEGYFSMQTQRSGHAVQQQPQPHSPHDARYPPPPPYYHHSSAYAMQGYPPPLPATAPSASAASTHLSPPTSSPSAPSHPHSQSTVPQQHSNSTPSSQHLVMQDLNLHSHQHSPTHPSRPGSQLQQQQQQESGSSAMLPHDAHGMTGARLISSHMPAPAASVGASAGTGIRAGAEKRQLTEVTDGSVAAPKAKRAKTKGKGGANGDAAVAGASVGTTTSKRGYNAKKRSEAAQIAAQAQLMPAIPYAPVISEKGKDGILDGRMQIIAPEGTVPPGTEALHPELQFARCMSNRYKHDQFPRCVSCTRRWAGDTCRFQGIRIFLKDQNRNIVGISFVESQKADAPTMNFPTKWNVELKPVHVKRIKLTVAKALLPTLRQELAHLDLPEVIRRQRESEIRTTCDTCMTSIFSSSWMCRLCGREACAECFAQVQDLTVDKPNATQAELAALQARRERHAHANPFFLSCTRRNEHQARDFSPMSRFCKKELEKAIEDMEKLIESAPAEGGEKEGEQASGGIVPDPPYTTVEPYQPPFLSQTTKSVPRHEIRRYSNSVLTEESFSAIWALGEPLVVTDVLPKFKLSWTPEQFIDKYGTQSCLVIECQTEMNKRITTGEFFGSFGKYDGRAETWKLKDWPPSAEFRVAFPELYEDFSRAVPVPSYVRRDGVLNVASHFPQNTVAPDLGPRMYNAMSSRLSVGSKGSTRLHMDTSDVLNIMTYSAPCRDGSPGCAAWDLFRPEDSDKIRAFLRNRFHPNYGMSSSSSSSSASMAVSASTTQASAGSSAGVNGNRNGMQPAVTAGDAKTKTNPNGATYEWNGMHDPIHSQQFYLDEELRSELFDTCGVMSYRVYQRPGDAIFIPAGCAHQVANLSDCIKVATEFVSPENVERCEQLTKEFREQNQRKVWKEDVLQLKTMMWFAWLSCCQQEQALQAASAPSSLGAAPGKDAAQ